MLMFLHIIHGTEKNKYYCNSCHGLLYKTSDEACCQLHILKELKYIDIQEEITIKNKYHLDNGIDDDDDDDDDKNNEKYI